ncbi:MAG: hypothetical protein ACREFB_02690, partial [Stellaceae bacterium]
LQLISTRGPDDRAPDDTEWMGEKFQRGLSKSICRDPTTQERSEGITVIRERLSNGYDACRIKHAGIEKRIEDMTSTYIARSDVYRTPLGRSFIVNCGEFLYENAIDDCSVSYVFRPGLGVTYSFRPYHGSPQILPIDQAIPFDRGLRAAINHVLVPNYPWPPQEKGSEMKTVGH